MKLVVGSNFIAWITAIRLRQLNPAEPVCVIEFGDVFGGNARSKYTPLGTVDLGMQTFYESEVLWANEVVWEAITASGLDVNYFKWPYHDPGLTSQKNKLVRGLHPIHDDHWLVEDYKAAFTQFTELQGQNIIFDNIELGLRAAYGSKIYESSLASIVQKFTNGCPSALSATSLAPIPLGRIDAINITDADLLESPLLSSRIAFKDPSLIPREFTKANGTIYPKSGGIAALVDALMALAKKHGVMSRSSMAGAEISFSHRKVSIAGFEQASDIFWCVSNDKLVELLGLPSLSHYSCPIRGSYLVLRSDEQFLSENAHYLLSYDQDQIFRLTFNGTLAGEVGSSLATVEMVVPPSEVNLSDLKSKLLSLGLISDKAKLEFLEPLPISWPISYKAGYEAAREQEEVEIKSKVDGLHLMNSNPAYTSIMQTPTMQLRLSSEVLQ